MVSDRSVELAVQDFRRARRQAALRQILSRLTGKSDELLPYNEVSDQLQVTDITVRGVQEIALDAIVGSVGRADDFTRDFLPKRDSNQERWARVKAAVIDMKGWPPIEVYQVGEVYFVIDGNHRVSVAKQLGSKTITAHVTEVKTRLPLLADDDPAEIIARANYLAFLEETGLGRSRPECNLSMTYAEQFPQLLSQIETHRETKGKAGRDWTLQEAAAAWYDDVYMPVVRQIRKRGLMRHFEGLTEADLYVQLSERREEIEEALGWHLDAHLSVGDVADELDEMQKPAISRLLSAVVPPELEAGPPTGHWRQQRAVQHEDRLFRDILVSLQGTDADWRLLDRTLDVAQRENGRVLALHAVDKKSELKSDKTRAIRETFADRCALAGIEGEFAAEVGVEGTLMIRRAAWVDLVTTNLTFASERTPLTRLSSGVNTLIQKCPRPILVLTGAEHSPMDRALLGYDGSPKAREALYVAAYLASRWRVALSVVTVVTDHTSPSALDEARAYLAHHDLQDVTYVLRQRPIAQAIFDVSAEQGANLLIMGGFGFRPLQHLMLGSTVDDALRQFRQPLLICR